jgi:DinB superfamily
MIGKHQPRDAKGLGPGSLLGAMADEACVALQESFAGLSDEEFHSFPIENRHNIVAMVEHCIQCLDMYCIESMGGELTFEPEDRFDIWTHSPQELRPRMTDLPSVEAEQARISELREKLLSMLGSIDESQLTQTCPGWFGAETGKNRIDAYWRAIAHTQAHVRQIWLLRGAMGQADQTGWPQQHWA